jgi:hypothetical protein
VPALDRLDFGEGERHKFLRLTLQMHAIQAPHVQVQRKNPGRVTVGLGRLLIDDGEDVRWKNDELLEATTSNLLRVVPARLHEEARPLAIPQRQANLAGGRVEVNYPRLKSGAWTPSRE